MPVGSPPNVVKRSVCVIKNSQAPVLHRTTKKRYNMVLSQTSAYLSSTV